MTRKNPPQHGERACYLRGCRLPECCEANYRYMSRIRLDYARGQRRRVDVHATKTHVDTLVNHGWNQAQIARAAGLSHRAIGSIANNVYPTTSRSIEQAILAIHIGPPPADSPDIDATGTIRRIRALIAIGYPGAHIATEVGIHRDALNRIARAETPCVRVATAAAVAKAYRRLSRSAGPSVRARDLARKNGWHGPLAWDDIDDPNAQPEVDEHAHKRGRPAQVDTARVARLTQQGLNAEQIARELGCHARTVVRARGRARDMAQAA